MNSNDLLREYTTLKDIYKGDYPDRQDVFWDFVTPSDLNRSLKIYSIRPIELRITLTSQYRVESLYDLLDMVKDERLDIVKRYRKHPNLSDFIIVMANNRVIDGNHRALAAALNNVSIRYVSLNDLDES
jgi:hypothetical protein